MNRVSKDSNFVTNPGCYESGIQSGNLVSEYSQSVMFRLCKQFIHKSRHCMFAHDPAGLYLLKMAVELIENLLVLASCFILL